MQTLISNLEFEINDALDAYSPYEIDISMDEEEEYLCLMYASRRDSHSISDYKLHFGELTDEEQHILFKEVQHLADVYDIGTDF